MNLGPLERTGSEESVSNLSRALSMFLESQCMCVRACVHVLNIMACVELSLQELSNVSLKNQTQVGGLGGKCLCTSPLNLCMVLMRWLTR